MVIRLQFLLNSGSVSLLNILTHRKADENMKEIKKRVIQQMKKYVNEITTQYCITFLLQFSLFQMVTSLYTSFCF